MKDWDKLTDPLTAAGIRCYEIFRDGNMAFEREGTFCFGPSEKISAFFSGSNESFLFGQRAQTAIAQLRKRAGDRPFRSTPTPPVSADNDGLATTRKLWEAERVSGQWKPRGRPQPSS
jgi:hypothetical protein